MKNKRTGDNRAAALRRVRPGRSNIAASEKIRDVGDNVPPGNNEWQSRFGNVGINPPTYHREGRCPQRPICFPRDAPMKNNRTGTIGQQPCAESTLARRTSPPPKRSGTLGTTSWTTSLPAIMIGAPLKSARRLSGFVLLTPPSAGCMSTVEGS